MPLCSIACSANTRPHFYNVEHVTADVSSTPISMSRKKRLKNWSIRYGYNYTAIVTAFHRFTAHHNLSSTSNFRNTVLPLIIFWTEGDDFQETPSNKQLRRIIVISVYRKYSSNGLVVGQALMFDVTANAAIVSVAITHGIQTKRLRSCMSHNA